jgi:hypothetical protein
MKAIQFALGSMLFLVFFASTSMAQFQRTFVSGLGNDSNQCTRTAPCRTFAQAISQTNSTGEVSFVAQRHAGLSHFRGALTRKEVEEEAAAGQLRFDRH